MAEYITKEQALETQCEKCPVYNCLSRCSSYTATKNLPTADVIERSKIDKAIEEIKNSSEPDYEYHGCGGKQLIIETEDVLEILKRNIGE